MKVPGIHKILKVHPLADASLFGVYKPGTLERPATVPPPLTGILDVGDLEPYRYEKVAQKGKKSKRRNSRAAPVPVVEQDTAAETDASEPVSPTDGPWSAHPISPPTYPGPSHHPRTFLGYEDPEIYDTGSSTTAWNAQTMYNKFGSTRSSLGAGRMAESSLAVRSIPPLLPSQSATSPLPPLSGAHAYPSVQYIESYAHNIPASCFPATYARQPAPGPSTHATHMQTQEGYSTTHIGNRTAARQPSVRRTQGGRRTITRSDPSMSDPHQSPTERYNPYARRLPQMASRNQVGEGAPPVPTYPVGPYWGATPDEQAVPNYIPAVPRGGDFAYPPQVAAYSRPSVISDQTTPIRTSTSSWPAPTLDASVSQLSAAMYGEWSPTDEDLQALQDRMDRAYTSGPSTSRRV